MCGARARTVRPRPTKGILRLGICNWVPAPMTPHELRKRRLHLGLSRDQLAQKVGVPIDEITEWEDGSSPIRTPVAVEHILRRFESPAEQPDPFVSSFPRDART